MIYARFRPVLLLVCGIAITAAAPPRETFTDRVTAVAADGTVTFEAHGEARFADLVFPDGARAERWMKAKLMTGDQEFTQIATDRYGRALIVADDTDEALLGEGVALIFAQGRVKKSWLEAERAAREGRRGVWADADLTLTPEEAPEHLWQFHLVEGAITRIYEGRSATYLNFGADWHTDFSVTISGRNRRGFQKLLESIGPGDRVRVRGMLYPENGAMIRLTRPEQLEVLR